MTFNTIHRDSEQPSVSKISSRLSSSVQKKRDIQCRQNEISQQQKNSRRAILTQVGHMSPVGWKPRAKRQLSAGKTIICSSRRVAKQFQLKSCMPPFGWKPRARNSSFSAGRAILRSSRTVAGQRQIRSGMHPFGWKPLQLSLERSECHTSHLTRHIEIQNSLPLAKPAADQAVPCRISEISQQRNGGGVVSTQIGHTPVWLEAQGQRAVQCMQNEISQKQKNSSRAVLTQIGHEPGPLEAQG